MMQSNDFEGMIMPNTFLIGAQKCATTSVYDWLSQHPEICAPLSVKDYEYYARDEFYNDKKLLSGFYDSIYSGEKVVVQGSVHYIYFKEALKRIKRDVPNAKCILILRNPIDRAISAYHYAVKFNYEDLPIEEAFKAEDERIRTGDLRTLSELTYKSHGLYYKQIKEFYQIFDKEQLQIIFYEDVTNDPSKIMRTLFNFLEVNSDFEPEYRMLNNTGKVKSKWVQKVGFGDNPIRNFFVRNILRRVLTEDAWAKLRFKVIHANTVEKKSNYSDEIDIETKKELQEYFKNDIENLESLLKMDLSHWK